MQRSLEEMKQTIILTLRIWIQKCSLWKVKHLCCYLTLCDSMSSEELSTSCPAGYKMIFTNALLVKKKRKINLAISERHRLSFTRLLTLFMSLKHMLFWRCRTAPIRTGVIFLFHPLKSIVSQHEKKPC